MVFVLSCCVRRPMRLLRILLEDFRRIDCDPPAPGASFETAVVVCCESRICESRIWVECLLTLEFW